MFKVALFWILQGNKKAPRTLQPKTPRQPSPRTAKPLLDSRISFFFVNVTLVICSQRK